VSTRSDDAGADRAEKHGVVEGGTSGHCCCSSGRPGNQVKILRADAAPRAIEDGKFSENIETTCTQQR
jgi:hypothetical protein